MLSGKLALVTGGGTGIGRAVCQLFAREGASVVVAGIDTKTNKETLQSLKGNHMDFDLNVSNYDQVSACLESIKMKYSAPPTIIVNSAGITKDNFLVKMSPESFQQVIDVNLKGTFAVTQIACQQMIASGLKGSIVNVASIVGQTGNIGQANYVASKAGVEAFSKTVAKEMGKFGIRCNTVIPGFVDSAMTEGVPDKVKNKLMNYIPMARFGKPEEIAEVIVFLASDRSSYMTGGSVPVTGGL